MMIDGLIPINRFKYAINLAADKSSFTLGRMVDGWAQLRYTSAFSAHCSNGMSFT